MGNQPTVAELEDRIRALEEEAERGRQAEEALRERVKELRCLYAITEVIGDPDSMESMLQTVANLLPPAFFYPEAASARIRCFGLEFPTAAFRETEWKLSYDLTVSGRLEGTVEVCYLQEKPARWMGPFMKEEHFLLNNVAYRLGRAIERLQSQKRLREKEVEFATLVETMPSLIWSALPDGSLDFCNRTALEFTGMSLAEALGSGWFKALHPEDRETTLHAMQEAMRTGRLYEVKLRLRRADGVYRSFLVRGLPVRDEQGNITRWYGSNTDITEVLRTGEEISRSHALLLKFGDQLPGMIFQFRRKPDGSYSAPFATEAIRDLFGCTPEQVREDIRPAVRHILPSDLILFAEKLRVSAESMAPMEIEYRVKLPGRPVGWRWAHATPEAQPDGSILWFGYNLDITDRKEFEREREKARELAETASRTKGEFLANMSHEIRTPLNSILGMVQLLAFTPMTEDQQECLQAIRSSSDSLLSLINNILDLSKVESGRMELEQRDFGLRALLQEVIGMQAPLIQGKALRLALNVPEEVPEHLVGDPLRLKQILLNLFGNAVKFTNDGGIRIAVEVHDNGGEKRILRFAVTDTGIGIPPEMLSRIFEPFTQADSSTTRRYGGTGLGLSICTRMAELMGGRVWAESMPGAGSTFFLEVPFAVRESERPVNEAGETGPALIRRTSMPLRFLLVDDQQTNRLVVSRILKLAGHAVVESSSGEEVLSIAGQERFDLILMDIELSGMSGIEAMQAIRRMEEGLGRRTPILAVTAHAMTGESERMVAKGFDGYIPKPIEFRLLFEEIGKCLPSEVRLPEPAASPQTPASPEAGPHVDGERLAALLSEMDEMLDASNLAVIARLSEVEKILPPSDSLSGLRYCIKRFDFDAARERLGDIITEYGIHGIHKKEG